MDKVNEVRKVQTKILDIMKYIDKLCRTYHIKYYIMGGTALGAIRHKGFIPWDDDLDIFMTPNQYKRFKKVFQYLNSEKYVIQEWKTDLNYLEYAKVRMNGTTFIEEAFEQCADLHQGIYVDIMILHKVPESHFIQKLVYFESKFVTLYALSVRNWKAKTLGQKIMVKSLKFLPCKFILRLCYRRIYQYDYLKNNFKYCYWITPAKFKNGLFEKEFFQGTIDVPFEDTALMASPNIKRYLRYRYGDYMKLPPVEERKTAVHAKFFDVDKDYREYIKP